jgi:hypothetical protein
MVYPQTLPEDFSIPVLQKASDKPGVSDKPQRRIFG